MATPGHSSAFLALVNDAKKRIKQVQASELPAIVKKDPKARVIDVREESEYAAGHVKGAEWLGKGIIERDIEGKHPDRDEPLYLYCGGGFRSALAADNLQKMGYTHVVNVDGGWRALKDLMPTETATHPFA
jgi:rhodanese-related sulfurtransferase